MLGYHTQGEFPDMWTLSENLRSNVDTVFVSKHYDVFFCKTKVTIFGTCRINLSFFLYAPFIYVLYSMYTMDR